MPKFAISVHAHFYQPPRANPLTGHIGSERSAAPYRNWNERANDEVYAPNATNGNFKLLSFDVGDDYLKWLATHHPTTSNAILDAVRENRKENRAGNVLAAPLHQCPLPRLSARDRLTQLKWGAAAVQARFGYQPKGVFLPQFAVDDDTLQAVVDVGYSYTLLRSSQVAGLPKRGGAGPYRLTLESGDALNVFVVNDDLTTSMFTEMTERGGAGYYAREKLATHMRYAGNLTLLYVDGELLGQHRIGEAHFIHYLLNHEAPAVALQPTTLECYYADHPEPVGDIKLTASFSAQDEPLPKLARAVADLKAKADEIFADELGKDAWQIRDKALDPGAEDEEQVQMITSQIALQSALAKALVVDDDVRVERSQVFQDVAHALALIQDACAIDLSDGFTNALAVEGRERFVKLLDEFRQPGVEEATEATTG